MNKTLLVAGTSIVSASLGAGATFLLMRKHFEEVTSYEIAEFKAAYAQRMESQIIALETANLNETAKSEISLDVQANAEIISESGYSLGDVKEALEQNRNIFEEGVPVMDWDQEAEEANRDDNPYVISHREYSENNDYDRTTLTYLHEDDVLVDPDGDLVPDPDGIVGERAFALFGYGSNDPNIVYVRNDELETDFQIHRQGGSYQTRIHGVLEHSDKPRLKKFRDLDY
jgi:hypothetical protein